MASIFRYVLVNADDVEDLYEFTDSDAAIQEAQRRGDCAVISREYEYTDSDLVWAPDNATTWPPKPDEDQQWARGEDGRGGEQQKYGPPLRARDMEFYNAVNEERL